MTERAEKAECDLAEAVEALKPMALVSVELEPDLWDDKQLLFAQGSGISVHHLRIAAAIVQKHTKPERKERCTRCGNDVTDWVDPDWSQGRICRSCETSYAPKS